MNFPSRNEHQDTSVDATQEAGRIPDNNADWYTPERETMQAWFGKSVQTGEQRDDRVLDHFMREGITHSQD